MHKRPQKWNHLPFSIITGHFTGIPSLEWYFRPVPGSNAGVKIVSHLHHPECTSLANCRSITHRGSCIEWVQFSANLSGPLLRKDIKRSRHPWQFRLRTYFGCPHLNKLNSLNGVNEALRLVHTKLKLQPTGFRLAPCRLLILKLVWMEPCYTTVTQLKLVCSQLEASLKPVGFKFKFGVNEQLDKMFNVSYAEKHLGGMMSMEKNFSFSQYNVFTLS